uniref:FLYWCH-type domain-containing protein n=1 Tax=Meloidogyne floridensis TaxID=298350 RepID=A0A915PC23_9BILA
MRVKYGLSSKSKKTFAIHGNYKYFKRRTVGGRVVWKCSKDKELGCCGSIWTRKSTIIFETEHACKGVGELTAIENYQVKLISFQTLRNNPSTSIPNIDLSESEEEIQEEVVTPKKRKISHKLPGGGRSKFQLHLLRRLRFRFQN